MYSLSPTGVRTVMCSWRKGAALVGPFPLCSSSARTRLSGYTPRMANRLRGCLINLVKLLVLAVVVLYGVVAITNPWAFHIGGRPTPFLYWSGTGKLVTKTGTYPLFVTLYPSSHSSRLHLDGLRPTGGVQGTARLCVAPGDAESLKLSGTIFGGWSSTTGALIEFRLLEYRIINLGQTQGYFDLYGRFQDSNLVMDDRNRANGKFRSGLLIQQASITLTPGSYSDFKSACAGFAPPHVP